MDAKKTNFELLFAYGTLQQEAVQLATFGRQLEGKPDALPGYDVGMFQVHRNLQFTGNPNDLVEGTVFTITQSDLEKADAYEPDGYKRKLVQLKSGLKAWVYLQQALPTADPN
jgi:gamma-glutamylcyclotransferase (GGCT)/AIG2-like uncharacterized protein YtfP